METVSRSQRFKPKGRKPKRPKLNNEMVTNSTKKLGFKSVDGYVCAVMDIWKYQFKTNRFPAHYPEPQRPTIIKEFLNTAKQQATQRAAESFEDRGMGTMAETVLKIN